MTRKLLEDQVAKLIGPSFDAILGHDLTKLARDTIGHALAVDRYGSMFFAGDATPRVVLKHPKTFKSDPKTGDSQAEKNLRESWENRYQGLDRSSLVAILQEGMELQVIGVDPEKAQAINTARAKVIDVCRWLRLSPHKLADLERATFSNIEHLAIEHVGDALVPWYKRAEGRLALHLLNPSERGTLYFEHDANGLQRGDYKTRMDGYRLGREMGLYTVNNLLELENENPIGPEGDIRHVPFNWTQLGAEAAPAVPAGRSAAEREEIRRLKLVDRRAVGERAMDLRLRLRNQYRPLLLGAARDIVKREVADISRQARKLLTRGRDDFEAWLRDFYRDHPAFVRKKLEPALDSYSKAVGDVAKDHWGGDLDPDELSRFTSDYLDGRAHRYAGLALNQLLQVLRDAYENDADPADAIDQRLAEWEEKRPDKWADRESIGAGDAFGWVAYGLLGVTTYRWHAFGKSCPWCTKLNDTVVGREEVFLEAGKEYQPEGADAPLIPSSNVRHSPAHNGCDCMVLPDA